MRLQGGLGAELANVGIHVDRAGFVGVVSAVRSKILDWAVQLKKAGIEGNDTYTFSEPEKRKA
jgi:hypothetical protein